MMKTMMKTTSWGGRETLWHLQTVCQAVSWGSVILCNSSCRWIIRFSSSLLWPLPPAGEDDQFLFSLLSQMKKCLHANSARPSEDRLTTVQFHPSAQVVMTAGLDQSVSLFQVQTSQSPSSHVNGDGKESCDFNRAASCRSTERRTRRSRASTWSVSPSTKLSSAWTGRRWSPPAWRTRCSTCTTWWRVESHLSTLSEVREDAGQNQQWPVSADYDLICFI